MQCLRRCWTSANKLLATSDGDRERLKKLLSPLEQQSSRFTLTAWFQGEDNSEHHPLVNFFIFNFGLPGLFLFIESGTFLPPANNISHSIFAEWRIQKKLVTAVKNLAVIQTRDLSTDVSQTSSWPVNEFNSFWFNPRKPISMASTLEDLAAAV